MLDLIYEVRDQLTSELTRIDRDENSILRKAELSVYQADDALKKLKELVRENDFGNQNEEILFFKEIKPSICSRLISSLKVFETESRLQAGTSHFQRKYLKKVLEEAECFYIENFEFCQYYRNGKTSLDDKFFVRGKAGIRVNLDPLIYEWDPEFSTSYDLKVAQIMANDQLIVYLKKRMDSLGSKRDSGEIRLTGQYAWTGSKASLIELIYGLYACCSINKGNIHIIEIARLFETVFQVDLGDFYHSYVLLKSRKNPTKFLDLMKRSFLRFMEENDLVGEDY